jgi:lipoyl-dependent peroxiredoxin
MKRNASAVWHGNLKAGKGTVATESGILKQTPYSFTSRFESGSGTNPEELIAAAHAGCFTMALSAQLGTIHATAESLATTATVTLENLSGAWTISKIHLDVIAKVPGLSQTAFDAAAASAKANCPVSRLLKAEITLDAKLESAA